MPKYLVHKAVNLDKVKVKKRAIISYPGHLEAYYIAQPKYDGCNMIALFDGENVKFLSRTGEEVTSVDHIGMAMAVFPGLFPGAYLGECWCPDLEFSDISGLFRRKETTEETARLQFAVFDYLTPEEWEAGKSDVAYGNRVARIPALLGDVKQGRGPVWLAGSFGYIAETWTNTTAQDVADKLVAAGGYDGLIMRDPYGTWTRGTGTTGEIIKIKSVVSLDLRVLYYEEDIGEKTGRKVYTIVVAMPDGRELRVGSGIPHQEAKVPKRGDIVEIEAMGYTNTGLLREPRFKGIRFDVLETD